jgi:creatinine amidohydrolase
MHRDPLDALKAKPQIQPEMRGVMLERLTWPEAERVLTPETVVMLPIGAAAKEHGPHLPLANDRILADGLAARVVARASVVCLPTLGYHHYPAFVEYPGSTSLELATARDVVVDICRSVARHGPRRFYALNTGVSTVRALAPAARVLAGEGLRLAYTDILAILEPAAAPICRQPHGTHADEVETSMMLVLAPEVVDMRKAARDLGEDRPGCLTRRPDGPGTYSPTGIFGDATLATVEKGRILVDALVEGILRDVEALARE